MERIFRRSAWSSAAIAVVLGILSCATVATTWAAATEESVEPEVFVYREVGGQSLHVHLFRPEHRDGATPTAAILLFHGGGWSAGEVDWTDDAARRYASLGMVAASVEYRLSDGTVTPIDALEDTRAAFRWVRSRAEELNVDPHRVAGYGVSAGGQLVAAAATLPCEEEAADCAASRPDLLLLWSAALDVASDGWFRKLLRGHGDPSDYSPAEHAGAATPPTCVIHGREDTLTPLVGVQRYCARVEKAGGICEMHVYSDVGHLLTRNLENQMDDYDPDPASRADGIEKLTEFLKEQGYIR